MAHPVDYRSVPEPVQETADQRRFSTDLFMSYAGDSEVGLNLQDAFTGAYDLSSYDLVIDYSQPPEVPLGKAEAGKAEEILAAGAPRTLAGSAH